MLEETLLECSGIGTQEETNMDWRKLKNGICPKCGSQLRDRGVLVMCAHEKCDFKIRESRLKEILSGQEKTSGIKYKPKSSEENMSDWNNDGLDEMAEDFSDSPHLEY